MLSSVTTAIPTLCVSGLICALSLGPVAAQQGNPWAETWAESDPPPSAASAPGIPLPPRIDALPSRPGGHANSGTDADTDAGTPQPFSVLAERATPISVFSLTQLYQRALAVDPQYVAALAEVQAHQGRIMQARSALLPHLQWSHQQQRSRLNSDTENRPYRTRTSQWALSQALFRPQNWYALKQSQALTHAAQAALEQAGHELLLRLIESYFDVLESREEGRWLDTSVEAAKIQMKAAEKGFALGSASLADVHDSVAQRDVLEAKRVRARLVEQQKRLKLGQLVQQTLPPLRYFQAGAKPPLVQESDLESWLHIAEQSSPPIRQARFEWTAAQASLSQARAAHLPTLDASASHTRNHNTGTDLTALSRDTRVAQVGVALNVPIFSGLETVGKSKEALALVDKAKALWQQRQQEVSDKLREAFYEIIATGAEESSLQTAERSLQTALHTSTRGQRFGLRSAVDVLQAQAKLLDTQKRRAQVRYAAWRASLRLKALAGQVQIEDLQAMDRLLVDNHTDSHHD